MLEAVESVIKVDVLNVRDSAEETADPRQCILILEAFIIVPLVELVPIARTAFVMLDIEDGAVVESPPISVKFTVSPVAEFAPTQHMAAALCAPFIENVGVYIELEVEFAWMPQSTFQASVNGPFPCIVCTPFLAKRL